MSGDGLKCDCVQRVNVQLSAQGARLVTAAGIGKDGRWIDLPLLLTEAKKGKPPRVAVSFCPFCGGAA